jgi:Zn-dependent protease with chaperone function
MRGLVLAGLMLFAAGPRSFVAATPGPAPLPQAEASPTAAPAVITGALGPIPSDPPRNEEYAHGGYALFLTRGLLSMVVLSFVVISGFGASLERLAGRVTTRAGLQLAVYAGLLASLLSLVLLPFDVWAGFLRERRFGFMNQGLGAWLGDRGKLLAVLVVVEMLVVPLLYLMMRRVGRSWWIPGAALATALVVVGQVVVPVFIAPLFNTFTPLPPSDLKTGILEMARAQGIPAGEVYEVDASRQSEHTNAYVAGVLGAQRIVLYDTLLRRMAPREILFVMGHEMGHYVLKHIWKTVAFLAPLFAAGLFLTDRIGRILIASRPRWRISGIERPSSLPLLLLILSLISFAARPIISTYSRYQESAADRFGIEVTRDPEAAASSFLKFAQVDLSEIDVNPVIEWALFTHPSTAHRIGTAQEWARRHGMAPDAARAPVAGAAPDPAGAPN